jgi:uncharacterized iron-regulated protein
MMRKLKRADVILFGETHNSVVDHQLQLQLAEYLFDKIGDRLALGAEMFEADDQLVIDEFLSGLVPESHLLREAKIWKNYETDYAPLLRFARAHGIPFIATNVPRRYSGMVARQGMDILKRLQPQAKEYMAPLPIDVDLGLSSYQQMLSMMQGHMGPDTDPEKMVQAQALKDATMAYFISRNLSKDMIFFHLNGSYHSNYYQGIMHYLEAMDQKVEVLTITSVQQEETMSVSSENRKKADFILVLPVDAPKSY